MPTGSLCAERNVIGSALADDVTLTRKDLKIIAVYSASIPVASGAAQPIPAVLGMLNGEAASDALRNHEHNGEDSNGLNGACLSPSKPSLLLVEPQTDYCQPARSPIVGAKRKIMNLVASSADAVQREFFVACTELIRRIECIVDSLQLAPSDQQRMCRLPSILASAFTGRWRSPRPLAMSEMPAELPKTIPRWTRAQ